MEIQNTILPLFEIDESLLPATDSSEEKIHAIRQLLIQRIEELIRSDLEKLKWILYRIDVSEKKLYEQLQKSETDAASVIADLIIERQIQKAESRKKFGRENSEWNFDV